MVVDRPCRRLRGAPHPDIAEIGVRRVGCCPGLVRAAEEGAVEAGVWSEGD